MTDDPSQNEAPKPQQRSGPAAQVNVVQAGPCYLDLSTTEAIANQQADGPDRCVEEQAASGGAASLQQEAPAKEMPIGGGEKVTTTRQLYQWQQEFFQQPKVWWVGVWFEGSLEDTGNYYTTREGAEIEAAYLTSRKRRARVCCTNLHNEDLARRRWGAGENGHHSSATSGAVERAPAPPDSGLTDCGKGVVP